jgi:ATP-binding cassette subfamily B protein
VLCADGANLSQGQRQLLAIARAAVADPPVLILDEATSSIDTRTEALVERGMDQLMEGRTVFVIAHRLSTVRNADAIMVLEKGVIIERGSHDDLIAQKGKYYQLQLPQRPPHVPLVQGASVTKVMRPWPYSSAYSAPTLPFRWSRM